MNTLLIHGTYLMRYLIVVVIVLRKNKELKDLVKIVSKKNSKFEDPISNFIEELFVKVDFDASISQLLNLEQVLRNDYFLNSLTDELLNHSKQIIFENYCRTHKKVDVKLFAGKLKVTQDLEVWTNEVLKYSLLNGNYKDGILSMDILYPNIQKVISEKLDSSNHKHKEILEILNKEVPKEANKETMKETPKK